LFERAVDGNVFDVAPVRGAFRPLRHRRSGFTYRCSECHGSVDLSAGAAPLKGEHAGIQAAFDHGANTRCLNCHHEGDRGQYVDHDGSPIPAAEVARLCGKCHGTIYRNWELGVHGRQNGYWDTSRGKRTRLLCIQCHDPHDPAFKPMRPDPAPDFSRFHDEPPGAHHQRVTDLTESDRHE